MAKATTKKKSGPAAALGKKKAGSAPKTSKRRTRKADPKPIHITEQAFVRSEDPAQTKILTQIQGFLREKGSRTSVLPYLRLLNEVDRLKKVEADLLTQARDIRDAIEMAQGTKLYAKLLKAKKAEPLPAKDAFKFT